MLHHHFKPVLKLIKENLLRFCKVGWTLFQREQKSVESIGQHFNTNSSAEEPPLPGSLPTIAYLLPTISPSGGVAIVLQHANCLIERGYSVKIITLTDNSSLDWLEGRAPTIHLTKNNRHLLNNIDVLVATAWNTVETLAAANVRRKFYFVQSDERRFTEDMRLRKRIHETYKNKFGYITEAKWIQRWLKEEFGHTAYYVPNGLDQEVFFPTAKKLLSKKPRILIEGAIELPYKGMSDSYAAVKDLDCELWIISSRGRPPEHWKYDRFFEAVPMEKMRELYSECDVFLKMSRVEGFFGPPLEAMACGCSVVVGKCTGYDEYIKDGYNALVVEQGDILSAKNAVQKLLSDTPLRRHIITNGKITAQEWTWDESMTYLERALLQKPVRAAYTDTAPERYDYKAIMKDVTNTTCNF